ncbi:hypothetical protein NQ314_007379 [Rhamnusium bicolor]|uniref:Uncharacterized protein n=1 Tax=Rhamnusium bicolor TaxID=1586634 RepID=A0AAV8YND0_9CUCU|nr:hypothetical protein NQ314_007379 [Rhamnusium bicolor]
MNANYKCDVIMKGHIIKINGKDHLEFDKFNISIGSGGNYFHFGNLFQQDPIIGKATHDVINDNTDLFVNEIRPAVENSLAEIFTNVANIITKSFTYDELFPES